MQSVNISVRAAGETIELTPYLSLRKYQVSDPDLGIANREVRQLHYTGWPDHGVPSDASLDSFM